MERLVDWDIWALAYLVADMVSKLLLTLSVVGLLLLLGDLASTFLYHVPEHAIGRLHCRIHHEKKQTFQHYAVLSRHPLVLLDGFLGALPYMVLAFLFWQISPIGSAIALLLGEAHVIWRHTTKIGWQSPRWIVDACRWLGVVTPEVHWAHHENGMVGFGDIFQFLDVPAQRWLQWLIRLRKRKRSLS